MTIEAFWKIIDDARQSAPKLVDVPSRLVGVLSRMDEQEIIDFGRHFNICMRLAYDANLWLGAVVILGGCGDDTFTDFRYWLIAQGREAFEAALADPDSMANLKDFNGDYDRYPLLFHMGSVDREAFCLRLGVDVKNLDAFERFNSFFPIGKHPELKNRELINTGDDEAKALFPKLAARFPDGIRSQVIKDMGLPDSPFKM